MITVKRLGYALGAQITGIDVSQPVDAETLAAIERAWHEHLVLCFPGQDLTPAQQAAFAARFGEVDEGGIKHLALDGQPGVSILASRPVKHGTQTINANKADGWHTDLSFTDRPSTATFLLAKQLPGIGGDTMFSSMYLAYDTLSPAFQRTIEGLEGVHDVRLTVGYPTYSPELKAERDRDFPLVVHPLVRTHPGTGRNVLFFGRTLRHFVGMTEEESRPLLDYLMRHATRYEFLYRHRWTLSDLVMWDNRSTMHYGVPDYDPNETRKLQRCTLVAPRSGYPYQARTAAASAI